MTPWGIHATGVLQGIGAPVNAQNGDTLWAWGCAESLPFDPMHINNPLDTTWFLPGATPWNTIGVGRHVWIYPTVADGITATVLTLQQSYYPLIVAHLKASHPRAMWGDACAELGLWGTGCSWLARVFPPVPDSFPVGGIDLTPAQEAKLDRLTSLLTPLAGMFYGVGGSDPIVKKELDAILTAASGGAAPVDIAGLVKAVGTLTTNVTVLDGKVNRLLAELHTP